MVTETDVTLAKASNAVIIAFNVKPSKEAKKRAEQEKISILERIQKICPFVIDLDFKYKENIGYGHLSEKAMGVTSKIDDKWIKGGLGRAKSWCDDEGYDYKKIQKQEVKKVLIKEQEKTSHGPPVFGKKLSDGLITATKEIIIGSAIIKLFETYLKLKEETNHNADPQSLKLTPFESMRSFLDNSKNYFPTLEQASMSIRAKSNINDAANIFFKLCKYVEDKLKTQIKVLPKSIMENLFSRYDPHRGRILISEALDIANKSFQIASQIALIEFDDLINEIIIKSDFKSSDEKYLLKMSLANYFGLALIMPYDEFKSS